LTPSGSVGLAEDLETVLDERGCVIVDAAGVLVVTVRLSALCSQRGGITGEEVRSAVVDPR
jgi:hypothetical protein